MLRLLTILITILLLPAMALAWPGKIVAVEGATTFVVLKDGQTPVKVNIAGVKPSKNMDPAKARMESSNHVLMRDVEVRELSKAADGTIIGDITVNGKSLSKELIDDGIVESSAQTAPAIDTAPVEIPEEINNPVQKDAAMQPAAEASASKIVDELSPQAAPPSQPVISQVSTRQAVTPPAQTMPAQIRYVQTYQAPQPLGLWPGRPTQVAAPQMATQMTPAQHSGFEAAPNSAQAINTQPTTQQMQQPGDVAKREYDLAVKVQEKSRRTRKPTGFFTKKRQSETYLGLNSGAHAVIKPKSDVPYQSWGTNDAISVRHFFPSGFGIGGEFKYSVSKGRSISSYDNATNSTSTYDYKKKDFTTYSLTASLLYRYYTGRNLTAYVGGIGGYAIFSNPSTVFHLSDGAAVLGGETGILYKFDSGFTLGGDIKYTAPIGTKSDDPSGYLGSSINIGYTFD
ncbi:hypothetical protein [Maridesulfovibrio sp.]|uniref:hypothetical protein n=1 Tax=Maridesulfovibrio sp. TaxID=2795000 RepID=UPI0029CA7700|nr:hypothetical protein [Maridesulfovibrio sp.]